MVSGYSTIEEELTIVWEAWCVFILIIAAIVGVLNAF